MSTKVKSARERDDELRLLTDDATLAKAFHLVHSIYTYREDDRKIALDILWEALKGVEVRLVAQDEADRHDPRNPTKVRWNVIQWFQLLIYCKSEQYEKDQEASDKSSLTEQDMIIRYIKHLILITCRRNSFHVSLGLSRLLYNYSSSETMSIYDLVFQDPDSSTQKADAYYRGRKNKLIEELKKRFDGFVRISHGARGETRFQTQDNSKQFAGLIIEYLMRFTPWGTSCELPEMLNKWTPIYSLQSNQINQIHTIIHPTCFSKITRALKLDPPGNRLAIPKFFFTNSLSGDTTPPDDGSSAKGLGQRDATAIRNRLSKQKKRRGEFTPRVLSIMADGIECARLDLAQSSRIRFKVEEETILIELIGSNDKEEILLGTHILIDGENAPVEDQSKSYSIVLEGGQKISLTLSVAQNNADDEIRTSVDIKYQETNPMRAAALWWQQFKHRILEWKNVEPRRKILGLIPELAVALLILSAASLILYFALRSRPSEPPQIAKQQPPEISIDSGGPTSKSAAPAGEPFPRTGSTPTDTQAPKKPYPLTTPKERRTQKPHADSDTITREQSVNAIESLSSMKRVYVDSLGESALGKSLRLKLIEKLQTYHGQFALATSPDEADTAITGSVQEEAKLIDKVNGQEIYVGNITVELLNVSGKVIWRTRKYHGTDDQIAARFVADLIEAIKKEARRGEKPDQHALND